MIIFCDCATSCHIKKGSVRLHALVDCEACSTARPPVDHWSFSSQAKPTAMCALASRFAVPRLVSHQQVFARTAWNGPVRKCMACTRTLLLEHPLGVLVCVACAATLASEYVEHVLDGVVRAVMQFAKVGEPPFYTASTMTVDDFKSIHVRTGAGRDCATVIKTDAHACAACLPGQCYAGCAFDLPRVGSYTLTNSPP